jgi:hypothetical protein
MRSTTLPQSRDFIAPNAGQRQLLFPQQQEPAPKRLFVLCNY